MENEFYKEVQKRNKNKYVATRSKEIETLQNGVDIPAFMYAIQEYNSLAMRGYVNCYGEVMKAGV